MKLKDVREAYQFYTGKASDIVRQLSFAGLATIWLFKEGVGQRQHVPHELFMPGALIVSALAADFLHYLVGSAVWGSYNRHKERSGTAVTDEFEAPPALNWPTMVLFWLKVAFLLLSYGLLLSFLIHRIVD